MALLEGSLWIAILLPLVIAFSWGAVVMHDQAVLRVTPEAALREVVSSALRWVPDEGAGKIEVKVEELRDAVAKISQSAFYEAQRGVFKAQNISTKACFWIFSVNSRNGRLKTPIYSECSALGPLRDELVVDVYMRRDLATRTGIPRSLGVVEMGYLDRAIITGVAIVGEVPHLLNYSSNYRISYGATSVPRQEISL